MVCSSCWCASLSIVLKGSCQNATKIESPDIRSCSIVILYIVADTHTDCYHRIIGGELCGIAVEFWWILISLLVPSYTTRAAHGLFGSVDIRRAKWQ